MKTGPLSLALFCVGAALHAAEIESQPASPGESLRMIHVPAGYEVRLAAAEPAVIDPVAIDWDGAGRLWVIEMADYPLGMDGQGQPGGRVRVLEDADGDGHYEKSTLFAEGLRFPTGLLTWRDGVLVTAAPEILFLKDTDGDGQADVREVLYSGFLEGNQQLRINGLRWGLDSWVYGAVGGHYRGYAAGTKVRSHRGGGETVLGSRDFRLQPDTGGFEPESGPAQFGRNRDDWGRWFGTQNSLPLWHYVLEDRHLRRNPHLPAPDPAHQVIVPRNPRVYPASPQEKRFHSFEQAGHFTSACSGMIYRDRELFPAGEMHALVCEPFHNLVHREVLAEDGVSFKAARAPGEEQSEFFASEDRWCRPVMARTGPDGALWVVDMYRYMIEHPEWLPENGKAELLPHYRQGDDKGRIYRVVKKGAPARTVPKLEGLSSAQLVAAFHSPNGWVRDKAQQMLLWRADRSVIAVLDPLARGGPPLARLHALWTLHALGALTPELAAGALQSGHPGLRENGLRMAVAFTNDTVIAAAAGLAGDASAKVRLQLACALGEWKTAAAGEALAALAARDFNDHFMVAAILSSAVPHAETLGASLLREQGPAWRVFAGPLRMLALGMENRALLAALIRPALKPDQGRFSAAQMEDFAAFLDLLARRKSSLEDLIRAQSQDELSRALEGSREVFAFAEGFLKFSSQSPESRLPAARLLTRDPGRRAGALAWLAGLIAPGSSPDLQRKAVAGLGESADDAVPELLLKNWPAHGPETREAILDQLMRREPWTFELLSRMRKEEIHPGSIDPLRRTRLARHESARVRKLAAETLQTTNNRQTILAQFQPALTLRGEARNGAQIFDRLCLSCHKTGDRGHEIGPDLRSAAGHPAEKLLANIIDPSADIQPGYSACSVSLHNQEDLYGIVASETANSLVLKLPDGSKRTVLRTEIAALRFSNFSLMPDGLEQGLSAQEMADLIAFVREIPAASPGGRLSEVPLARAHAHNDYEHPRPLWDALAHGFCSVEADIHLVDGRLLVAHDLEDVQPERTFERLYLEPLRDLARKNGGRVYPGGPGFILLVDFKSDAEATYAALKPVLRQFESILTRFRDGKIETNAVTVILSGNRPREQLLAENDRLAAYDGRLADLGKGWPVSFMPLVSDNFVARFPSAKEGRLSAPDRQAFRASIQAAHAEGKLIRFWAAKDDAETWKMLREAGVDLINTDRLAELAAFLRER